MELAAEEISETYLYGMQCSSVIRALRECALFRSSPRDYLRPFTVTFNAEAPSSGSRRS